VGSGYIVARGRGVVLPGVTLKLSVVLLSARARGVLPGGSADDIDWDETSLHRSKLLIDFLDVDDGKLI
jgi:hypothetical protein